MPAGAREGETRERKGKVEGTKVQRRKRLKGLFALLTFLTLQPCGVQATREAAPPDEMVLIPAGKFLMGSSPKDGRVGFTVGVDELPQHTVDLKAYFIDRYEVTAKKYRMFIEATGRKPPGDPRFPEIYPWAREGGVPKEIENNPVIYVSWNDAASFCEWAGKRLPTEAEWEKAARGTDGRIWPWGNIFDPQKANVQEYKAGGTLGVGSFPKGVSPYGVYDMAGNVAEWTADWYQAYPGSKLVRGAFGKTRVVKGGAYTLPGEPYARSASRSMARDPEKRHRSIGFRCAMDIK